MTASCKVPPANTFRGRWDAFICDWSINKRLPWKRNHLYQKRKLNTHDFSTMEYRNDHISVCICTFKRPRMLAHLLSKLEDQETCNLFAYSIVVADNDYLRSAEDTVMTFKDRSRIEIEYVCEPQQNIALARNKCIENAKGNYIAFIDDDEFPLNDWLLNLYKTCIQFNADGVLGPVKPYFEIEPPDWIIKGRIYERPMHATGQILHWSNTRTGNVLLKKVLFNRRESMFKAEFGSGGEDRDFFKRLISRGFHFVWCNEAPVYETVPPERFLRSFMLRRALLRGKVSLISPSFSLFDILKSFIAVSLYAPFLPFLLLFGQHVFMRYLIKMFDHLGKIFAFIGLDIVREKYVMK